MHESAVEFVLFVVGGIADTMGPLNQMIAASPLRTHRFAHGSTFMQFLAADYDPNSDACVLLDHNVDDISSVELIGALGNTRPLLPVIVVARGQCRQRGSGDAGRRRRFFRMAGRSLRAPVGDSLGGRS